MNANKPKITNFTSLLIGVKSFEALKRKRLRAKSKENSSSENSEGISSDEQSKKRYKKLTDNKKKDCNEKSISKKNLSHHSQTGSELESHNAGVNFYVNDGIIIYFYFDFLIEIIRSKMIIILV